MRSRMGNFGPPYSVVVIGERWVLQCTDSTGREWEIASGPNRPSSTIAVGRHMMGALEAEGRRAEVLSEGEE